MFGIVGHAASAFSGAAGHFLQIVLYGVYGIAYVTGGIVSLPFAAANCFFDFAVGVMGFGCVFLGMHVLPPVFLT
jgi:hypothetical protein